MLAEQNPIQLLCLHDKLSFQIKIRFRQFRCYALKNGFCFEI